MISSQMTVYTSLAFRYHHPRWSLAANQQTYGSWHNVDGLGANMAISLEVEGDVDLRAETERLKLLLDHRCLFEVEPYFDDRAPTPENILLFLKKSISGSFLRLELKDSAWTFGVFPSGKVDATFRVNWGAITVEAEVAADVAESGLVVDRDQFATNLEAWMIDQKTELNPDNLWIALKARVVGLRRLSLTQPNGRRLTFFEG